MKQAEKEAPWYVIVFGIMVFVACLYGLYIILPGNPPGL